MTRRFIVPAFLCLLASVLSAESRDERSTVVSALQHISPSRMVADVSRLSAEFHGRLTGTADDIDSARFVAARFAAMGLQPGADSSWMMSTDVAISRIAEAPKPQLHFVSSEPSTSIEIGEGYLPILDSPSVDLTAPVTFVGYGISDSPHGWDEYAGFDVRNRIVVFFRGKPQSYARLISHSDKIRIARDKGAAAFLTLSPPTLSSYETRRGMGHAPLAFYHQTGPEVSLPGAWIHTELAERLLSADFIPRGRSLSEIQQELHALRPQSFESGMRVHLKWDGVQERGTLYNVVGVLPGSDASTGRKTVLVGAHRDHFGRQAGLLFPGADDNASGTAVLLEVAHVMMESGVKPKCSVLFVSFSGEEEGLLGSRFYVDQPVAPLSNTTAMINIDHAGVGNGRLTIGAAGLDKSVAARAGNHAGMADHLDLFGFFPGGDHVPFNEAGVPTITVVSGGSHPHFHRPSDTPEIIQPEILERTAKYVLALVWQLTKDP